MRWIGAGILSFLTLANWFGLYLMRRDLFFGVTVAPDFRDTALARNIMQRYRIGVISSAVAALMLILFAPDQGHSAVSVLVAVALFFAGASISFGRAHSESRVYAIAPSGIREVELLRRARSVAESGWMLMVGPLILAAGFAAAFLTPDSTGQMPLLTGWSAVIARWNTIDALADSPLSFALGFWFGSFLPLLTFRFGSRRTPSGKTNYRRAILRTLLLVNGGSAAFATWLLNAGALGHAVTRSEIRGAMVVLGCAVAIHFAYVFALRRKENMALASEGTSVGDHTPDQAWLWGMFYHNSDDPALFVEARNGPGYTVNFGHVRAWLLLATIPAAVVLALVFK
jgi:uncharacterized membrane protein